MKMHPIALASAASLLTLAACGDADSTAEGDVGVETAEIEPEEGGTLFDEIGDLDDMEVSEGYLEAAGLKEVLGGEAPYTVFLPADDGYGLFTDEQRSALSTEEGRPLLVAMLSEHIVPGYITEDDLRAALGNSGGSVTMTTYGEGDITFTEDGDGAILLGSGADAPRIVEATTTENGVIYRIDRLLPPEG